MALQDGSTDLNDLVAAAREDAEARASDFEYRESAGWEAVAHDFDFWREFHWMEVERELEAEAERRSVLWNSVAPAVRAAFDEAFREHWW